MTTEKKEKFETFRHRRQFFLTFDSPLEIADLRALRRSTEDASVARHRLDERPELLGHRLDLLGELAGRCQHEYDRTFAARQRTLVVDVHEAGQHVRERLA